MVDNTTWCERNNCLTSIGGDLAEVKAAADGTVYGLTSAGVLQQWTQSGGWVNAPSSLQSPGGNKITHISVGSATEVLALTNAPYPDENIYTLVSGAWQPPSTDPTLAGNLTTAEIAADGSMFAIGGGPYCCQIYQWNNGGWEQVGTGTFQNLANAGGGIAWAVATDGYLEEYKGCCSWTQVTTTGFTPSPAIDALAAVGSGSIAAVGIHGGIQVSYNGGSTFSLLDGTVCSISGGDPFLFVRGCNGTTYHVNLLVPQITSAATGSYATWCSATPGNKEVCSEAVHTLKSHAYFGGVGGANGTSGVTLTAQGNPANTLNANATETGTYCDFVVEDPDQYSACQAYYDGSAVCSVMGALNSQPTASSPPQLGAGYTLVLNQSSAGGFGCVTNNGVTICSFLVAPSCKNTPQWAPLVVDDSPPGPVGWYSNYACGRWSSSQPWSCLPIPGAAVRTSDTGPVNCPFYVIIGSY